MISRSSGSCGSDRNSAVNHISTASTRPREMPATAPTSVPTPTAIIIATMPTASDMRPPYSMRANRSWPRSSVPIGWRQDGPFSLAVKSMSLIATGQINGPNRTRKAISPSTTRPAIASLWRRNRRQASAHGELLRARSTGGSAMPSAVGDAGVEPAIEDVGEQVEEDYQAGKHERHRHDYRRVVGEDRGDEQRADARHAEDLLGDDGAAENRRQLQPDQRDHRDHGVPHHVLHDHHALGEPLGARRRDVVEPDHVQHRGAHVARPRCSLEEAQHRDRHDRLSEMLPIPSPPGRADVGAVDEWQPV